AIALQQRCGSAATSHAQADVGTDSGGGIAQDRLDDSGGGQNNPKANRCSINQPLFGRGGFVQAFGNAHLLAGKSSRGTSSQCRTDRAGSNRASNGARQDRRGFAQDLPDQANLCRVWS